MVNYKEEIQSLVKELKEQGYNSICFFQPAYTVTGATICKVEMAKYLANNTDIKIYFCDFVDGNPRELIKNEKRINFVPYIPAAKNFPINEKCAIFASSTRVALLKNMHPENKILFWHNETVECAWNLILINGEINKYFRMLKKQNAMVFHDWSSRDSLNRCSHTIFNNDDFFYVSVGYKKLSAPSQMVSKDVLNVAFMSRLSSDKVYSLLYLVHNLYYMKVDKKIRLHVIGDGLCMKYVQKELNKYTNKIEIIYTGTIPHDRLDEYLISNIDILYGVGTCCIEAAALKIPTVVLIMSNKKMQENEAFWYYNTKDYCVGITQEQKSNFFIKFDTIEQTIIDVLSANGKKNIGNRCFRYFCDNHGNYQKLVINFLKCFLKDKLTFKKLQKCIKYVPYSDLRIKKTYFLGCCLYKKVIMNSKSYFYFLGIRYLKSIQRNNKTIYYLWGIKMAEFLDLKTYNFPNSMIRKGSKNV